MYEAPARLLLFVCLMLLVGVPIGLRTIALPILVRANLPAKSLFLSAQRIQAFALLGIAIGALLLLFAQVVPLELDYTPAEWSVFAANTTIGQMALLRIGLGVIGLVFLWIARHSKISLMGCVLIGLVGQGTLTRTSHTYAMGSGVISFASDFAHLIGGGLWVGGLVAMALTLAMLFQVQDETRLPNLTIQLIRRFGTVGIISVTMVCATGVLLSPLHITQPDMLVNSLYGLLLTVKVVGVFLAIGLAALHKFVAQRRIHTRHDVRRFATTLQLEMILLLLVYVGAAFLTAAPPPMHQMSGDMQHEMLSEATTTFQNLLRFAALGIGVLGLGALVLEWRPKKQT